MRNTYYIIYTYELFKKIVTQDIASPWVNYIKLRDTNQEDKLLQ